MTEERTKELAILAERDQLREALNNAQANRPATNEGTNLP
jgi:hypothetical protein